MSVETMNPDGIFKPSNYSQMSIARGSRMIFLSGQVAQDTSGNTVGAGDLAAQAEQAYRNVGTALRAAGATFQDIAKLTVYVVDWRPEKLEQLVTGAMRAGADIGFDPFRSITLIGVAALASPEYLIEVEAVAVID